MRDVALIERSCMMMKMLDMRLEHEPTDEYVGIGSN